MPKHGDENGIKARATKSQKAKRNFELNGSYSSKHLRLREEQSLRLASGKAAQCLEKGARVGNRKR